VIIINKLFVKCILHITLPNRFDLSLNGETYFPSSFMSPVLLSKFSFGIQNLLNIINLSKQYVIITISIKYNKNSTKRISSQYLFSFSSAHAFMQNHLFCF